MMDLDTTGKPPARNKAAEHGANDDRAMLPLLGVVIVLCDSFDIIEDEPDDLAGHPHFDRLGDST